MPIELRTGLPGAGKTLGAVESLIERRKKEPHRALYVHGITDLRDGLAIPLDADGVKNWEDLPAGSVLYVDEVQKLMPATRGNGGTPEWITKLSEHRHLGLDFVFITQHPSLISSYVRTLVDRHIHTVRFHGTKSVERYIWPLCVSDPNSKSNKRSADGKSRHIYSKDAMQSYKSSELHTIKPKIPKFVKIAAALLVIVPLLAYGAYFVMHRNTVKSAGVTGQTTDSPTPSGTLTGSSKSPLTPAQWIRQQVPRVAGIPWSAPIFDEQKIAAKPELYCMEIEREHGTGKKCGCITEQGTHATVPDTMCRSYAEGGVYNPYREPSSVREMSPQIADKQPSLSVTAQPGQKGEGVAGDSPSKYPDHSIGAASYTPPQAMPFNAEYTAARDPAK